MVAAYRDEYKLSRNLGHENRPTISCVSVRDREVPLLSRASICEVQCLIRKLKINVSFLPQVLAWTDGSRLANTADDGLGRPDKGLWRPDEGLGRAGVHGRLLNSTRSGLVGKSM